MDERGGSAERGSGPGRMGLEITKVLEEAPRRLSDTLTQEERRAGAVTVSAPTRRPGGVRKALWGPEWAAAEPTRLALWL